MEAAPVKAATTGKVFALAAVRLSSISHVTTPLSACVSQSAADMLFKFVPPFRCFVFTHGQAV
jgi:hypothetical protein